jgi:hypothetical protein
LLVGSDISNIVYPALCQVGLEQLLYRGFSRLGLDTAGAVFFLSEMLGQPSAGRHLCSKLMLELYSAALPTYVPTYLFDCIDSRDSSE